MQYEGQHPKLECCKRGMGLALPALPAVIPHGHGVPAARVLLRRLYRRCLATRWCRSPGLGQLRNGRDGSLPCLRWGPCLPCLRLSPYPKWGHSATPAAPHSEPPE